MKSAIRRITAFTAALATTAVGTLTSVAPALAASAFDQREVDQSKFIAVASPIGSGASHQLLILEQISTSRQCWSESGNNPTIVNPLLLSFDFTGICGRSTDSNGHSIRVNGQDLGLQYSLRVVRRDNNMVLVGSPFNRSGQEILIGHTGGVTSDFAKIRLYDGWRFTRRMYQGQTLGHTYLTFEGDLSTIPGGNGGDPGGNGGNGTPTYAFRDIAGDIYASDIQQAVTVGFIAGFPEDNTFRPLASLTREQLVSIVLEGLDALPNVDLNLPTTSTTNPFPDVASSRWSAAKIQFAQNNNIVTGYQDGLFRPAQAVTRAELMAVLRRASEYALSLQGQPTTLVATQNPTQFTDIAGHWGSDLITNMSGFCGIASPLNERGTAFFPDQSAQRNYATAATLRMMKCVDEDFESENGQG
jgi:N-acetylmuramoyl-L-alanine amidase